MVALMWWSLRDTKPPPPEARTPPTEPGPIAATPPARPSPPDRRTTRSIDSRSRDERRPTPVPSPFEPPPRVVVDNTTHAAIPPTEKPEAPTLEPALAEPAACGDETTQGRCEGDEVVLCYRGEVRRVDCAAHDQRCVPSTGDGAYCADPPEEPCADDLPRCEGDVLIVCQNGETVRWDCGEHDTSCDVSEPDQPGCLRTIQLEVPLDEAPDGPDGCGPCGCPPAETLPEGGALRAVAFHVVASNGESAWGGRAAIEQEIAVINALFESTGLSVELEEVIDLDRPSWRVADSPQIAEMMNDPDIVARRDQGALVMVLTDELMLGRSPRLGMSGGGIVMMAAARHWTTGAHEVGHFLGLPHTHEQSSPPTRTRVVGGDGATSECERCAVEGDRICDTPEDPGRGVCSYELPTCQPVCEGGWAPDVSNLMGYYHECRRRFSDQQIAVMRQRYAERFAPTGP